MLQEVTLVTSLSQESSSLGEVAQILTKLMYDKWEF